MKKLKNKRSFEGQQKNTRKEQIKSLRKQYNLIYNLIFILSILLILQ